MTADSDIPHSSCPRTDRAAGDGCGTARPRIVVASVPGTIVQADSAARGLLQLAADAPLPVVLDAAMPALVRVRALVREGAAAGRQVTARERLVFWTAAGPVAVEAEASCGVDGLVAISLDAPGDSSVAAGEAESAYLPPMATPSARDGAAVGAIAARIRAGMARRQPEGAHGPAVRPAVGVGSDLHHETGAAGDLTIVFARLAHELRTPLSAVVAMAEIIRDERLGATARERYREYAGNIHESARHALSVVAALLDASAVADGSEPAPTFAEIDVRAIVATCVDTMMPLAQAAGISIEVLPSERLPHIVVDARALRQILLNLMTNALKFTPRGGRITVSSQHDADGPLAIAIADTGLGMSEAELQLVLEAMASETVDAGLPREGGGRGLGLPMVRRLAAQSGGQIVIASVLGRGTTVTVSFDKSRLVPV